MGITSSDLYLRVITLLQNHKCCNFGRLKKGRLRRSSRAKESKKCQSSAMPVFLPSWRALDWDFLCGAVNRVGGLAAPAPASWDRVRALWPTERMVEPASQTKLLVSPQLMNVWDIGNSNPIKIPLSDFTLH